VAEKRRDFAERFDRIHSIERAVRTGSVKTVVEPKSLRGFLIDAVERGIRRTDPAARTAPARTADERAGVAQTSQG